MNDVEEAEPVNQFGIFVPVEMSIDQSIGASDTER